MIVPFAVAAISGSGEGHAQARESTNATYFNDASTPGADPFVLYDADSGYYYAYSTYGADDGHEFGIYRSPDLATWERLPGGALDRNDGTQWGHDWFWAPEVYHNTESGLYFLFYSARMNQRVAEHFRYADFEEPSKIGVAVAHSPQGPFRNITNEPIDYYPYDPAYHDVNLIMDATQKKPPETLEEGMTAPLGTYIPFIDPNVFFDDGRIYLYYSRNAYRNWVWDHDLGKYIEESNIHAVELTSDWWHDPAGTTMPAIDPDYVNANRAPDDPPGVRKDGFTRILNYGADKQAWENAHVNDYAESGGEKKDRRWAEGSTTIKARDEEGRPRYFLTFSANNYQNEFYGVGYAVASSPLGPWRKSAENPILEQNEQQRMYSTGHGSVIASPDGSQLYYVHHGRPSTETTRRLYTERMRWDASSLVIDQSTGDEPIPSGVAPYALSTDAEIIDLSAGRGRIGWMVVSAAGAAIDLSHPLNRVTVTLDPPDAATVEVHDDHAILTGDSVGVAALTLQYQRKKSNGEYYDVDNVDPHRRPVAKTVPVVGCASTITGEHGSELEISHGVTCLKGATVSGPVRIEPGASLVAIDSVVEGPVLAHGANSLWLFGGRVSGPINVQAATGIVRLDRTAVGGQVDIAHAADVTIEQAVTKTISLVDNKGARPVVVADSAIDGALSCTGNVPAPTNAGRANTVRGPSRGQCEGL